MVWAVPKFSVLLASEEMESILILDNQQVKRAETYTTSKSGIPNRRYQTSMMAHCTISKGKIDGNGMGYGIGIKGR